jgi:hypothetical protein
VLGGEAPAFVKQEGQFYEGGPVWRVELASPRHRCAFYRRKIGESATDSHNRSLDTTDTFKT